MGKTFRCVLPKGGGKRRRKRTYIRVSYNFYLSVKVFDTVREGEAKSNSKGDSGSVTTRHFDRPVGNATRYEVRAERTVADLAMEAWPRNQVLRRMCKRNSAVQVELVA